MPRTLILMRHAKQTALAASDHERPLTDEGRDAAHRVGETLRREGLVPDRALSSTALRCHQTWECVSAALAEPRPATFERDLYNATAEGLLDALSLVDEAVETLLVLAHNPGISVLAIELAGGDPDAVAALRSGFTPASTARFAVDGPWATVSARSARFEHFDLV